MKQTSLDFRFSLSKKHEIIAAEKNEKEMVSVEDNGREAEDVSLDASDCVGSASLQKFLISWLAKHCFVLLFRQPTSLSRSICL